MNNDHYEEALRMAESGRLTEARTLCERHCSERPDDLDAWLLLGVVNAELGRSDQAEQALRKVIENDGENTGAHLILANVLSSRGRLQEALDAVAHVTSAAPEQPEGWTVQGAVQGLIGRYEAAEQSLKRALELAPGHVEACTNLGHALKAQGRLEDAAAQYRQALAVDPARAEAYLGLGMVLQAQGALENAVECFQNALRYKPRLNEARAQLGFALLHCGDPAGAEPYFRQALALQPAAEEGARGLFWSLFSQGRLPEALAHCKGILQSHGDRAEFQCLQGLAEMTSRDYQAARTSFERSTGCDPGHAGAWTGLGELGLREGDPGQAAGCFRRALVSDEIREVVEFSLAATGNAPVPDTAPPEWILEQFQQRPVTVSDARPAAGERTVNEVVGRMARECMGRFAAAPAVLDLGCGTGWLGPIVREKAARVIGVDLSSRMLELARRRGAYDALLRGNILAELSKQDSQFELIVAADVFMFFGDLAPVFGALRSATTAGGYVVFTIQDGKDTDTFRLGLDRRYHHALDYVRAMAGENEFTETTHESVALVNEFGDDVPGAAFVFRGV